MRKSHRLKRKEDFAHVYTAGRSAAGRLLVLYALQSEQGKVKIGFAAGRKLGSAVTRNRAKRMMREIARRRLLDVVPGYSLILIARAGALKATFIELNKELSFLLRKLNLLYQG
ncbi:MAG: ribonuclease P protein component [Bacillota bacterium]|nr:MAG: ribonuclease P protein component [Bacillota bacterium]MBS3951292.1 ribonuclease P protein component [Peptococcaceae bacterium]